MHTSFLRYFDEVARQRSIRKAAAILNITSTTVNRKIIAVEQELGVRLFDRTPAGVLPTEIGMILLEHCRRTLHDFERTKILLDEMRDKRTGHLTIQTLDSAAFGLLPRAIQSFYGSFPHITLSVTTAMPEEIVKAVAEGKADVGITFVRGLHPNVRIISEKAAPFGVILPAGHPLAQRGSVRFDDIADFRLIRTVDARGRNSIIDQMVTRFTAGLSTHLFTNTLSVAKRMILGNQGIGIYTKIGFYDEIERGEMAFVPIIAEELRGIRIGLIVSAASGIDAAKKTICNAITRELKPLVLDS
ncbi:MAG: LysR family transcriptional regulator [Pseudorhodobacter sp.]